MAAIGERIVELYGLSDKMAYIEAKYHQYDAWAVGIAGFTPIPYKVFTIAAGAFKINFPVFVFASILSRSARFFLVAGLIRIFGEMIQPFIEKYLDILAIVFVVLLVGSFIVIKYLF
jgi:membrane protein YqaA with SNARE-associated domain